MKNIFVLMLLWLCYSFDSFSWAANRRARSCLQPIQSGNCFGYVPSYAYNPFARRCEQFIYGGCGGNDNRFETHGDCDFSCRDI